MITVYKVTNIETGNIWHRLSIAGILEDQEIGISVTPRYFSMLAKNGYPFEFRGYQIEKFSALSTSDVRKINKANFFEEENALKAKNKEV